MTKKVVNFIGISLLLILFFIPGPAVAGGLFGPPQSLSREDGGLNTAVGYGYHEDKFENDGTYVIRQNQIYSQVAYGGARHLWEVYGRIGIADLEIDDAYRSEVNTTTSSKDDFEENEKFFGTLGAKIFFPLGKSFGVGAFLQGTYFFSGFTDEVSGRLDSSTSSTPYSTELKVKDLWDITSGISVSATVPYGIVLYAGPYLHYSEARVSASHHISGIPLAEEDATLKNKAMLGGYAGISVPLGKGFFLNAEGQYSERFSVGIAVTYAYQNRGR
ncbi:hypothetical protein [Syntrophus gentianae]|nr:hypothetical protein [Syntrophus gentianae]